MNTDVSMKLESGQGSVVLVGSEGVDGGDRMEDLFRRLWDKGGSCVGKKGTLPGQRFGSGRLDARA